MTNLICFFNWYFFTLTFSMMVASTLINYIQGEVNWALGFAIPTFLMFFSCAFYFVGSRLYVKIMPEGSPFTSIAQVLIATFSKRRLKLPDNLEQSLFSPPHASSLNSKLSYADQFSFHGAGFEDLVGGRDTDPDTDVDLPKTLQGGLK